MENSRQKLDWYSLWAAVIMLIIGVTMLIWPIESSKVLIYVVAGLITLAGLIRAIIYFTRKERTSPFSFGGLSIGLSLVAIGAVLLLDTDILTLVMPVVLGCLLVFSGFGSLQTAVELMRLKIARWYVPLIFALLALICGFIALANPFATANILMGFLGVALTIEGILLIASVFMFRRSLY